MTKKAFPWGYVIAGGGLLLTISGMLFGNLIAFGKQQEKNTQVEKRVADLEDDDKAQDKQLTEADKNYALIQRDIADITKTQQAILEAVKKR